MAGENTDIRDAIKILSGINDLEFESFICTVSNINLTTYTCTCTPIDGGADFLEVFLSIDSQKGFLLIPKDGSLVAVSQLNDSDAYLTMVSEVDNIYLIGDAFGGLVKVEDLVTKLNNLENKVNDLITAFNAWTPIANDGGAALKAAIATWVSTSLTPTVRANIENTKIKHG